MAHHNTDLWRVTAPVDGARWGLWPLGGAWLSTHLWEHYAYGGDHDFLARAYPIMKGAAEFVLDFLVEDEQGRLVTNPSHSPWSSGGRRFRAMPLFPTPRCASACSPRRRSSPTPNPRNERHPP